MMRKLLCLLLTVLFLPVLSVSAESPALSIDTPAEAVRPGKAFLLSFSVPADGDCDLILRDMSGNAVMTVVTDLAVTAGRNQLWWNGTSAGVPAKENVYQLALVMDGQETSCTVVVGDQAPYLTSIVPVKDAESQTMTVDFYASVSGLLSVGLWSGNVWSLLENRQVSGGMNRIVWDASGMTQSTTALTLTLTDATGFSSNEEHISLRPEEFGITIPEETPVPEATPVPEEVLLTPIEPLPGEELPPAPEGWDQPIDIDHDDATSAEVEPAATATPVPLPVNDTVFTPSYGSPYPLTEKDKGTYWGTPMDITDEEAIWTMLTAPFTYYKVKDDAVNIQRKIYAEPDADSRQIGVITTTSQAVRVIENLDNGWSLIETYSSTFHDNSVDAWNMLIQGYVKTSNLKTKQIDKKYHIVVDKLTQRLYLFGEGKLLTTLLVSTGLSNETQPYNETRSGEFVYCSPTGGFWSDNMFAPMGMKFNDGDLLHEVPYVQRSNSNTRIYSTTEPYLGQRASHGCIRVQRKLNADGYNMEWIWDNRKDIGRLVVWEDWQGRQVPYPENDLVLYYNADGGTYYHKEDHCDSAKDHVVFTPFTYAELDSGEYAKLEFCPYCAPALRRAELDQINLAHAPGGDHDPILTEARQKWLNKVIRNYGKDALTEGEKRYYLGDTE
ncbi:MAG: L,D-transpeptidase family protein [Clostridia bacterium]|nr:L,D-transpeptidase family protein [Clostridia bacterium]